MSIAFRWHVVRRAIFYSVVVGPILILINHWDSLIDGQVDKMQMAKMALTFAVPYCVSTLSSVSALREGGRR